jgi:hypothetical protein
VTRAREIASQGGLVLLNTTTFSAQSSVSIDNVFSSTYQNYKIMCNQIPSTASDMNIRMRVSGADDSTSNYKFAAIGYNSNITSYSDYGAAVNTWQDIARTFTAATQGIFVFDVLYPNETKPTIISGKTTTYNTASSGIISDVNYTGWHNVSTAYTGFTMIPTAGTTTGTIKVYGYK